MYRKIIYTLIPVITILFLLASCHREEMQEVEKEKEVNL